MPPSHTVFVRPAEPDRTRLLPLVVVGALLVLAGALQMRSLLADEAVEVAAAPDVVIGDAEPPPASLVDTAPTSEVFRNDPVAAADWAGTYVWARGGGATHTLTLVVDEGRAVGTLRSVDGDAVADQQVSGVATESFLSVRGADRELFRLYLSPDRPATTLVGFEAHTAERRGIYFERTA